MSDDEIEKFIENTLRAKLGGKAFTHATKLSKLGFDSLGVCELLLELETSSNGRLLIPMSVGIPETIGEMILKIQQTQKK